MFQIDTFNSRYKFSIGGLSVNLKTGLLRVSPDEKDVVQNVALAFVVSTLYLLVQPRPQDPKAVAQATVKRGPKKVNYNYFDFDFLANSCSLFSLIC